MLHDAPTQGPQAQKTTAAGLTEPSGTRWGSADAVAAVVLVAVKSYRPCVGASPRSVRGLVSVAAPIAEASALLAPGHHPLRSSHTALLWPPRPSWRPSLGDHRSCRSRRGVQHGATHPVPCSGSPPRVPTACVTTAPRPSELPAVPENGSHSSHSGT